MKKLILALLCLLATLLLLASCGNPTPPSEFSYYECANDGVLGYQVSHYTGNSEHVVIPSEFKGKPVISIGELAFQNNNTMKTVEIPSSIRSISQHAFINCSALESLTIPPTVQFLVSGFATRCEALIELSFSQETVGGSFSLGELPALKKLTAPTGDLYNLALPDNLEELVICPGTDSIRLSGNNLKKITISEGIKGISKIDAPILTELSLPSTITYIGELHCPSLKSITLPEGLTSASFAGCSSLESITLPEGLTTLGDYNHSAFGGCSSLKEIVIPSSVTTLEANAFEGCTSLERIVLPNNIDKIPEDIFASLPNLKSVKAPYNPLDGFAKEKVDSQTFSQLLEQYEANPDEFEYAIVKISQDYGGNVTYAKLPKSIHNEMGLEFTITREIGETPLSISGNISIILGEGVTEIGAYAFKEARIKSLTLPNTLTKIGEGAFMGFELLGSAELIIPDSVIEIGEKALFGVQLESVTLPEGLTSLPDEIFSDAIIKSITLPSTITEIGYRAFYRCEQLTEVNLSASLVNIGVAAFEDCSSLTSITLPQGLTTIREFAFEDTGLTSLEIPKSVTTISNQAFKGAPITSVTGGEGITSISRDSFYFDLIEETVYGNVRYKFLYAVGPVSQNVEWIRLKPSSIVMDNAFENCQALYTAFIPEGVVLGSNMFYNNSSALRVFLEGNVPTDSSDWRVIYNEGYRVLIGGYIQVGTERVKMGSVTEDVTLTSDGFIYKDGAILGYVGGESAITFPASTDDMPITSVAEMALAYRTDITSISIDGIKTLSPLAFAEMDNLVSVTLSGVETIDQQAFMNCTSLKNLSLGEGLGYIRAYAFYGCTSLEEVTMPASLYTLMEGVFMGCTNLTAVNFDTANTSWTVIAYYTEIVEVLDLSDSTIAASTLTSDSYAVYMFANSEMLGGQ